MDKRPVEGANTTTIDSESRTRCAEARGSNRGRRRGGGGVSRADGPSWDEFRPQYAAMAHVTG